MCSSDLHARVKVCFSQARAKAVSRCACHRSPCMGCPCASQCVECGGKGRSPPRRFGSSGSVPTFPSGATRLANRHRSSRQHGIVLTARPGWSPQRSAAREPKRCRAGALALAAAVQASAVPAPPQSTPPTYYQSSSTRRPPPPRRRRQAHFPPARRKTPPPDPFSAFWSPIGAVSTLSEPVFEPCLTMKIRCKPTP